MKQNARIIISVTSDLCTDQRVLKTAKSLHQEGYDILLVGRLLKNSSELNLEFPSLRLNLFFNRGFLFYAEYTIRLFFLLISTKADLYLSNDTDTLVANYLASTFKSKKLVFDAHELFPEVPELADRKFIKSVWEFIEASLFPRLKNSYTVCRSIASYYNQKYGIKMEVVRNVPYLKTKKEKILHFEGKKILLFQGAVNTGRGLEWIIDALPYLPEVILYIIGDGDVRQELETRAKRLDLNSQVIFHGKVTAEELSNYTSSADLGLCMLEKKGLSYYYSLPNRIFDYLHAGVAVLSTPFPEIKKIVEERHTGYLTEEIDPLKLAQLIQNILKEPMDTTHFTKLSTEFCWENEEKILKQIVRNALNN